MDKNRNYEQEEQKKDSPKKRRPKKKHHRVRNTFLVILSIILVVGIVGTVRIMPLYHEAQDKMYDILADMDKGTFHRATNTRINDKDGNLIGKVGYEKYQYVNISKISDYIQEGYIDTEDKNFKTHHGVDWMATFRAGLMYIKNRGHITQGGSTITQQVIKNNLLSQERTFNRKIMEILIARQLEKEYNKAEIMEFYCNSNYYGNSCYGVEGASQYYFGVSAQDVDLAEAAMLVATSNSPNRYNPVKDYELCMTRKKFVLQNMLDQKDITQEEYDKAVAERPEIVRKTDNVTSENYMTTYAIYCADLILMENEGFDFKYTFKNEDEYKAYQSSYKEAYQKADDEIRSGGFTIDTSIDTNAQKVLQSAVDSGLSGEQGQDEKGQYLVQGAAVSIDNSTGLVNAIVGGRGTDQSYNRGYQATRQPGSSIKPLLDYGPGLNEGVITPGKVMDDHVVDYNGYAPKNSGNSYMGNVSVREALARSLNTVAVQVFHNTGENKCLGYLDKLKFSSLSYADRNNMAIALGGFTNGVTVADMARGYAAIENGGQMRTGGCIRKLTSETEGQIYQYSSKQKVSVYNQDTAFMLTDMLQGTFNEDYGTAHRAYSDGQYYAGKTGTTDEYKDAWFAGFSPYYTTVVWTGCDTPTSMEALKGNNYPLTIWAGYMNSIHQGLEKKDYKVPSTIELSNGSRTEAVTYSTNVYASRPAGYDYVSGLLAEKQKAYEDGEKEKALEAEVEETVAKFESFTISSVSDIDTMETLHSEVQTAANTVNSEKARKKFLERIATKYNALEDTVKNQWGSVEKAQSSAAAAQQEAEVQKSVQESASNATSKIRSARIRAVQSYIDALNSMTVKNESAISTLKSGGEDALAACSSYSYYSTLSSELSSAISRAEALPTQAELDSQAAAAEKAASDAAKAASEAAASSSAETSSSSTALAEEGGTTADEPAAVG